jgi:hypothetical protein
MADVKVLIEAGQSLISGHDNFLSGTEREKGRPEERTTLW